MKILRAFALMTAFLCLTAKASFSDEMNRLTLPSECNRISCVSHNPPALIRAAEELADWKMYSLALPAYSHVIQSLPSAESTLKTFLSLRKAQMDLLLREPRNAIESLQNLALGSGEPERSTLMAFAFLQLNEPRKALQYLQTGNRSHGILCAMAYRLMGKNKTALEYLNRVASGEDCFPFTRILMAKIAVDEGTYHQAYEELKALQKSISPTHDLYPQVLWLLGTVQYQLDNIPQSIVSFEEALTLPNFQSHQWYSSCIEQLVKVYLAECDNPKSSMEEKDRLLTRAEQMVNEELKRGDSEHLTIAMAKILFAKNRYFPSDSERKKCKDLLCESNRFTTNKLQMEALILQAQMATGYLEREHYLSALFSLESNGNNAAPPFGWLLRGNNERERAYQGSQQELKKHLELALVYYQKAYELFDQASSPNACEALKNWAQTAHELKDIQELRKIYEIVAENATLQKKHTENYYVKSLIEAHLYDLSGNEGYLNDAIEDLQIGLRENRSDVETLKLSLLLGKVYFLKNSFIEAEAALAPLSEHFPDSPLTAESLYWSGRAAEKSEKTSHPFHYYYRKLYTEYPSSPFAAEAFFRTYTFQNYLHGEKEAKRHLEEFVSRYPDSRFVMDAYFLLGLDSMRDRKSAKGKWISKSNLTKAIDLFQQVGTLYQNFTTNNLISESEASHYSSLEMRATLEIALCNLAIARMSSGAKKHIYLQYAEEVFASLVEKFGEPNIANSLDDTLEEAMYGLAQTHLEAEKYDQAEAIIHQIIDAYESSKVTRGYYLSRAWHDLSLIALSQPNAYEEQKYHQALEYLHNAEECAKGRVLSTDQTIDLWLKMSDCHKMLGQYDQSMRYLTKAIDEDAISNLRVKAMYLRAEIYELQGRMELSRKQLEATSKKGGEWGQKAKDQLGKIYGYH